MSPLSPLLDMQNIMAKCSWSWILNSFCWLFWQLHICEFMYVQHFRHEFVFLEAGHTLKSSRYVYQITWFLRSAIWYTHDLHLFRQNKTHQSYHDTFHATLIASNTQNHFLPGRAISNSKELAKTMWLLLNMIYGYFEIYIFKYILNNISSIVFILSKLFCFCFVLFGALLFWFWYLFGATAVCEFWNLTENLVICSRLFIEF